MSGGKSSSTTQTTQQTTQLATEGIVGGDVYQGENITVQFTDEMSQAFLATLGLAEKAIGAAVDAGGAAIQSVSQREEQISNPELATLTKLMPALMLGIGAIAVVLIFKRK